MLDRFGFFTPRSIKDAQKVLSWAENVISRPHPKLGRDGSVCPFVPPSLKRDAFYITFHYEVDGKSKAIIQYLMSQYKQLFLGFLSNGTPNCPYNALLAVFPNVAVKDGEVVDAVARQEKTSFVQSGLMLGEFHLNSTIKGIRNPEFRPMVAPFPMLVIRHMAVHDILFLNQKKIWFDEYHSRFGHLYQERAVSNKYGLVDLYYETKQKYIPDSTPYRRRS